MTQDLFSAGEPSGQTFTVSQLNRKVKDLLEVHLPLVWVEGEVSNLSRPSSGHWYFTLKDESAQVSCAMFKRRNTLVKFRPAIGDHLKVRAHVSLYEARGDYQLIVEHMEQAGFGLLQQRFEALKAKLLAEGLFDAMAKQAMPPQVRHLAVVTSPSGAAIRDVLSVLERRFPLLPVTIIPSPVQGEDAPTQLVQAIETADRHPDFDAILICRGGGSIEDLWAFNSEALARAIFACKTPVMCAVGHEVDFTIADFAADVRAPTPSAAAELLSPEQNELRGRLAALRSQLRLRVLSRLTTLCDRIHFLSKRLKHPRDRLEQWNQRLDNLELRLTRAMRHTTQEKYRRYMACAENFDRTSPRFYVTGQNVRLGELRHHLLRNMKLALKACQQKHRLLVAQLDIVSPVATIARGYSIARQQSGEILRSVDEVAVGEKIFTTLIDGEFVSRVEDKTKR